MKQTLETYCTQVVRNPGLTSKCTCRPNAMNINVGAGIGAYMATQVSSGAKDGVEQAESD